MIELGRLQSAVHESNTLITLGGRGRLVIFTGPLLRDLEARASGQVFDGLRKRQAQVLHQKTHGRAMGPAAKAVIELLAGTDRKRGGLLGVKRAQPAVVDAGLFELHITADELDDVDALKQCVNEGLGNHGLILTPAARLTTGLVCL